MTPEEQNYQPQSPHHGVLIIAIAVVILACGAAALSLVLGNKYDARLAHLIQENTERIAGLENKIIVRSEGTEGEIAAVVDTSHWQDYKNDELGFSLRIPGGITPQEKNGRVMFCPSENVSTYSDSFQLSCLTIGMSDDEDFFDVQVMTSDSPFVINPGQTSPFTISGIEVKESNYPGMGSLVKLLILPYQDLYYFITYPDSFSETIMERVFASMQIFGPDMKKLFGEKRDTKRVSDLKQFQTALELRFVDTNNYPYCLDGSVCTPSENELGVDIRTVNQSGFNGTGTTYMGRVARDPQTEEAGSQGVDCITAPSAGCNPVYRQISPSSYRIDFFLENDTGGLKAGSHCALESGMKSGRCQ